MWPAPSSSGWCWRSCIGATRCTSSRRRMRGGKGVRHQVPVTRVRYAPARWETLAYRGRMVAAARTPWGLSAATSLVVRQARAIAGICSDGHIDLVHAHWWAPGGISAWLARRPYVVTLHGTDGALLERFAAARWVA